MNAGASYPAGLTCGPARDVSRTSLRAALSACDPLADDLSEWVPNWVRAGPQRRGRAQNLYFIPMLKKRPTAPLWSSGLYEVAP